MTVENSMLLTGAEQAWLARCWSTFQGSDHLADWLDGDAPGVFVDLGSETLTLDGTLTPTQLVALTGLMAMRHPTTFPAHVRAALMEVLLIPSAG